MRLASSSEAPPHHSHAMKQTNPAITVVQSAANATSQSSNYNMLRMTFLSNSVLCILRSCIPDRREQGGRTASFPFNPIPATGFSEITCIHT